MCITMRAGLGPRALDAALGEFIAEAVDTACRAEMAECGRWLAAELEAAGLAFAEGIETQTGALLDYAADLFGLPAVPAAPAVRWPLPGLTEAPEEEPSGLALLAEWVACAECPAGLARRLPRLAAAWSAWARRRRALLDAMDSGCGQVRYGCLAGLEKARIRHAAEVVRRRDATVAGIEAAFLNGIKDSRLEGEKRMAQRNGLEQAMAQLEGLARRVEALRRVVEAL
jgi:hypothetical protein